MVRGYGSHDLTVGERRILRAKLKLVSEFTSTIRRRGGGPCDGEKATALIKAAIAAVYAEKQLIGTFPSLLIRERGLC
jgi:hypothetical protein